MQIAEFTIQNTKIIVHDDFLSQTQAEKEGILSTLSQLIFSQATHDCPGSIRTNNNERKKVEAGEP